MCLHNNLTFAISSADQILGPNDPKLPISDGNPDRTKFVAVLAKCATCGDNVEFKSTFIGMNEARPSTMPQEPKLMLLPFEFESDRRERERKRKKVS